jgi:hypothetical protein
MFCGGGDLTKEDAWPLWLLRRIGADGPGEMHSVRGPGLPQKWRVGKAGIRIGTVCRQCNNGWMSNLETAAKPVIESLLDGANTNLACDSQRILGAWAIKGAMVLEPLRLKPGVFTAQERAQFRQSLLLPPHTKVWVAKVVDSPGATCETSDLFSKTSSSADQVRGYVTTMAFGELAIQVLTFRLPFAVSPSTDINADMRPGPWDSTAIQVWPSLQSPVTWPGKMGLNGESGLHAFSQRWIPLSDPETATG